MPEEEAAISEADAELLRDIEALLVAEEKDKIGTLYAGTAAEGHEGGPYPWQVRFHTVGADSHLRCIMAGNRCVAPHQVIETEDGSKRADEVVVGDRLMSWDAQLGRTMPGEVSAVIHKTSEPIYRVEFSTGEILEASGKHHLLTQAGWFPVFALCHSREHVLDRLLTRAEDARRSERKEQGSRPDCPSERRSDDARPPWDQEGAQVVSLRLVDAVRHIRSELNAGGRGSSYTHNPFVLSHPLSSPDAAPRILVRSSQPLSRTSGNAARLLRRERQVDRRFHGRGGLFALPELATIDRQLEYASRIIAPNSRESYCTIVRYSILPAKPLIDFTVEHYHNYIAAGVVNHNSGKTRTGSAEVAIHLTGRYPDWWTGRRFDRPIECWVGSETNEASRDIVQKALLGPPDSPGTGMIPAEAFDPKDIQWRQAGIPDVADMVKVRHASGGISYCQFKTYEQGRKRWQGTAKDLIWLDEEPPVDIFTEAITRTLDKNGTTILTFTPLMGMGDVVLKVLSGGDGIYLVNASWDDCPHLDEQAKARLLETYPEHERATRKSGQPMLGVGAVYPVQDDEISCDPFAIPNYFRRICGIDFGINHPAAAAWIAHDADTDVIYVYDCYRKANESAPYHAAAIRRRGPWIPVAWPHDGMNRDKGSGIELAEQYRSAGVNILPFSARYDDEKGGGQPTEPVVNDILERMRTGRFKVFRSLNEWFEEKRMYHRNDRGVIVRERDDLMSGVNYAVMMVRHAMSESNHLSMKRFAGQTMEPYDALGQFLRR